MTKKKARKQNAKIRRQKADSRKQKKPVEKAEPVDGLKGLAQRHWQEWLIVAALVGLAAVLRMNWVGTTEFKADEARLLALALDMADGEFALRGISSSVGLPNFPMSVWLYTLPLVVWPHPYAATLFTGLLSTLAVLACYWLVRRYWGAMAAIAATLLFAVSPWAVMFSRKIWAQNLLPLFVMLWVIGLALALVDRKPRFMWLALVALAVAVQIHLSALALVPATLVLLIVFWRRLSWQDLLIGAGLALLTAVPFLIYLFQQSSLIGEGLAKAGGEKIALSLDALNFVRMISVGNDLHSLVGPEQVELFLAQQGMPMTRIYWLMTGVLAAGLIYLGVMVWKRWGSKQGDMGLIVLVWTLSLPLFFLVWRSSPVYLHYFIALLPAPYIAAGVGFSDWQEWFELRYMRVINWVFLIGLSYFQVRFLMSLLAFVGQTATPWGFGTPLSYQLEAAETAVSLMAETGAVEILVVGEGDKPNLDDFPAVWDVLLRDAPHRFVDGTENAVFPAEAVVVVVSEDMPDAITAVYTEHATLTSSVNAERIPLREGEGEMRVLVLPGGAPEPDVSFEELYLLSNFVRFLGHDELDISAGTASSTGSETSSSAEAEPVEAELVEAAIWQIYWQTADNPDPTDYHVFNHLLDGNGERVSQADGDAFSGSQWQPGDVVVSWFEMPWDDDWKRPLTMRSGMYNFDTQEPVLLLDEAGNPYTDAVEIPVD
jgi:4-amino-4-deoxy-L-arabinose transferase-like glycosyltransferase